MAGAWKKIRDGRGIRTLEKKTEKGKLIVGLPLHIYGRVKTDGHEIRIFGHKKKTPSYKISFLRQWTAFQNMTPEALDGKKVKVTIEVVD